jgi:hypothetical protein
VKIDPAASDAPMPPPVSAIVVLDHFRDPGRVSARPRRAIRLRRLAECCDAVPATPVTGDAGHVAWETDGPIDERLGVTMTRQNGRTGHLAALVSFDHPDERCSAVILETTLDHDARLDAHVTERTMPVLAALARAAAAVLDGSDEAMAREDWWDASFVLCAPILATSPHGPAAIGRDGDPRVVHDHVAETPLTPASLTWNRLDAHVPLPAPDAPAVMTMVMGGDGVLDLRPLWSPTCAGDTPDAMTALRVMARVEEARRLSSRRL